MDYKNQVTRLSPIANPVTLPPLPKRQPRTTPIKCPDCSEMFRGKFALKQHHRRAHTKKKSHFCQVCHKGFMSAKSRNRHSEKLHNEVVSKGKGRRSDDVAVDQQERLVTMATSPALSDSATLVASPAPSSPTLTDLSQPDDDVAHHHHAEAVRTERAIVPQAQHNHNDLMLLPLTGAHGPTPNHFQTGVDYNGVHGLQGFPSVQGFQGVQGVQGFQGNTHVDPLTATRPSLAAQHFPNHAPPFHAGITQFSAFPDESYFDYTAAVATNGQGGVAHTYPGYLPPTPGTYDFEAIDSNDIGLWAGGLSPDPAGVEDGLFHAPGYWPATPARSIFDDIAFTFEGPGNDLVPYQAPNQPTAHAVPNGIDHNPAQSLDEMAIPDHFGAGLFDDLDLFGEDVEENHPANADFFDS